jgi:crotonobetainyl-CoA:carnitine CoA-transferase CaiB-like acyl-CoA transferase
MTETNKPVSAGPEKSAPVLPLQGLRIIDLTTVIMGPYATQILADYGADVIKVEPPDGDVMRGGQPMRNPGMGAVYLQLNRNKRAIVLDLKRPEGRDALLRLCRNADVIVSNIRPAAMRRLRLGDDDLRAANPKLINVALVGYGQAGPYAKKPAYDDLMQGISGVAALFLLSGSDEPRYVPLAIGDRIVGLHAVNAVLAAVIQRDRTGEGVSVEVPMFETMVQLTLGDHMAGRSFEPPLGPTGYNRYITANRKPYRTKDGYVCVLVYMEKHWRGFMEAMGRAEAFYADPRFSNHAARAKHYDEAYAMLAEILLERTTAEWTELFERLDIPCVPLNDLDAVIADPHLNAVGFFTVQEHPSEGTVRYTGIPSRWNEQSLPIRSHAPRLGEQSVSILREAGLSETEIAKLVAEGVTVDGSVHAEAMQTTSGPAAKVG